MVINGGFNAPIPGSNPQFQKPQPPSRPGQLLGGTSLRDLDLQNLGTGIDRSLAPSNLSSPSLFSPPKDSLSLSSTSTSSLPSPGLGGIDATANNSFNLPDTNKPVTTLPSPFTLIPDASISRPNGPASLTPPALSAPQIENADKLAALFSSPDLSAPAKPAQPSQASLFQAPSNSNPASALNPVLTPDATASSPFATAQASPITNSSLTSNSGPTTLSANPSLPAGLNALSPAQQTGKQVGDLVTKLLEEVPALQEKIDHIDWDTLSQEEIMPKLEKMRASVQPTFSHVPKFVDRKMARMFEDPQNQKMAAQFFKWLREEPDPETLTALQREKTRPQGGSSAAGLDELDEPSPRRHRPIASEDDFADDEAEPAAEKQTLKNKLSSKVSDLKDRYADKLPFHKKADSKSHGHSSPASRRLREDDFSDPGSGNDDDFDLDSLLQESRPRSAHKSGSHSHRPSFDDY